MTPEELVEYKNLMMQREALHHEALKMMAQALGKYDVYVQTHVANKSGYVFPQFARVVDVILTEKYLKPFYKEVFPFIMKSNDIDVFVYSPPPGYNYFEQWVNTRNMKPGKILDMEWLKTKLHSEFPPATPYDYWWRDFNSPVVMKRTTNQG